MHPLKFSTHWRQTLAFTGIGVLALGLGLGCDKGSDPQNAAQEAPAGIKGDLLKVAKARALSTEDMMSAVATYTGAEQEDEFVCLNSGGQAGSVIVYGVLSAT